MRRFEIPALVLLPDHLHCIWKLLEHDSDYSTRWRKIKETFTRNYLSGAGRCGSGPLQPCPAEAQVTLAKRRKGLRGVWQQRFWEHTIRDELDFGNHVNYIHFNPVKHALCRCAHEWPWSTFQRWIKEGYYQQTWCCQCDGRRAKEPDFSSIDETAME